MSNVLVTQIFCFVLFLWIGVYWFVSFSNPNSFIHKFKKVWKYTYALGLIFMSVSCWNIFWKGNFRYVYSVNMFLLGGMLTMIATVFQMNKKKNEAPSRTAE